MKAHKDNLTRRGIPCDGPSPQDIFNAALKHWRQRLGYCSIFATVPALLASHVPVVHSDEGKKPEVSVAGQGVRFRETPNLSRSNPALLKRQSEFLLPHQLGNLPLLTQLAGNDDCPGFFIPGGNYTAAAPYTASGDTTGANNTINNLSYCYYFSPDFCIPLYFYTTLGPDHIYTFTLTGRGANPQLQVSASSSTYRPAIYILDGRNGCPGDPGRWNGVIHSADAGGSIAFDRMEMNSLPLNVPLHLFVDSEGNGAGSSGPYSIRMQDVTIAPVVACPKSNAIECTDMFVRQHYLDFLNREGDAEGLAFWMNEIEVCGTDAACLEVKRINVSAAFFLSTEFQETGYLAYRIYKASYGNLPGSPVPIKRNEFQTSTQQLGQGVVVNQPGWEQVLENNKQSFVSDFVHQLRFALEFPTSMTPTAFVDQLFANAEITPTTAERADAINEFGMVSTTDDLPARARALRRVAENSTLMQAEFNRAFVLIQYFGYLRRNPNDFPDHDFQGYNFWLKKLNQFNGNFVDAEMVKAFITSGEYRQRFGP